MPDTAVSEKQYLPISVNCDPLSNTTSFRFESFANT